MNEYISHAMICHLQQRFNTAEMGHLEALSAKKEGSPTRTWVAGFVSNVLSKIPEAILGLWEGTPRYPKCLETKGLRNPFCSFKPQLKSHFIRKVFLILCLSQVLCIGSQKIPFFCLTPLAKMFIFKLFVLIFKSTQEYSPIDITITFSNLVITPFLLH